MYRFLLTPRWLAVTLLALLAVPVCVFMGSWQLSRFDTRVDQHKHAEHDQQRTAEAAPVPLSRVLPKTGSVVGSDDSGRIVSATGHYDTAHQLLVPNRLLDNHDGFYVLTPLRLSNGAVLPVVRGWLPGKADDAARAGTVPAAPTGTVTVTGAVQYPETTDTTGVDVSGALPPGQLGIISGASLVNVLPYPVYGGWITANHPAKPLVAVPPAAPPNSGLDLKAFQNLGYTGQWFVFAGFAVFMWFRFVRREAEARADAALGILPDQPDGPDGPGGSGGPDGPGDPAAPDPPLAGDEPGEQDTEGARETASAGSAAHVA
ncbi:Cytochrome oxidase assembly protein ShyY1 [Actinacidiphila yanglinensis]|uniref:SURF1-like protein n=1 Tax=Actinacidiphila yanglinensis TaxID=310779 RepID=A0A1H6ED39_9ACTN|nr:SURF1 family protein [Actinacidiphila yanglinensis]SEG95181.1 Cytochrome oxidase assembly protein ShyY1 [Actinacidiphila yanglinensis]